jgi:hypothetical protein
MKKIKVPDWASNWEKELYGSNSYKLKAELSPKPSALFKAQRELFGDKTDDETIKRLIIIGSIKFSEITKLKEQMDEMNERLKSLQEENEKLWKKDNERDDFFRTWAADKQGFEALIRTKKHFEEMEAIRERKGLIAAQKLHEDYIAGLYEKRDDLNSEKKKFIN